jgi:hypothetical protein
MGWRIQSEAFSECHEKLTCLELVPDSRVKSINSASVRDLGAFFHYGKLTDLQFVRGCRWKSINSTTGRDLGAFHGTSIGQIR